MCDTIALICTHINFVCNHLTTKVFIGKLLDGGGVMVVDHRVGSLMMKGVRGQNKSTT